MKRNMGISNRINSATHIISCFVVILFCVCVCLSVHSSLYKEEAWSGENTPLYVPGPQGISLGQLLTGISFPCTAQPVKVNRNLSNGFSPSTKI